MSTTNIIKINPNDNVAVAIHPLKKGESFQIDGDFITVKTDVPQGHKVAVADISEGRDVIKYGAPIGCATAFISKGEMVHSHNLKTKLEGELTYSYDPCFTAFTKKDPGTFMGFRRHNGKVGIRNEIWIIPTVGCVNSIGDIIAAEAEKLTGGSVDGVYSFSHPYGCSQLGDDHENTKKALLGLINHPNAGGVLVLGLGCENNSIDGIKEALSTVDDNRVKFLICQHVDDEVAEALKLIEQLIDYAKGFKREDIPMSELVIGLKCGGSDGLSGITANPLLGAFSDRLIMEGGTSVLTEVPEMFGAETLLMNRCESKEVFEKTVLLINDFKAYFTNYGQPIYENPSPGNKEGGITTLEDKSLGCTQKSGSTPVVDVLKYGDPLCKKGLNLLESPGNDLVASTALAVSGAHMVLFTTGRGTPFGCPVPTLKISSNTHLYKTKGNWIDFDAGVLVLGATIEDTTVALYDAISAVASGRNKTKTELNNIRDMAIFKTGITL